jgi:2Fe-2S ferredoxin
MSGNGDGKLTKRNARTGAKGVRAVEREMPLVNYIDHGGACTQIDVPVNDSVMEGAIANSVAGIVAECGGSAMCATCHVYVREDYLAMLPPLGEVEDTMLDLAASERRDNSRLSCQIRMTADLDGLTVQMPESQT